MLADGLKVAKLPPLTVYQATRHSFGAQWVKNGGSLVKLAATLGHSNTEVTARYSHLVPGEFSDAERALVDLDLEPTSVLPTTARSALNSH
jgi:site-specific recombinase XerD